MNNVYERLKSCYESIKGRIPFIPKIALILGSGLGDYAETIKKIKTIDYSEIKDFPVSTVSGHKGIWLCRRGSCCYYAGKGALL